MSVATERVSSPGGFAAAVAQRPCARALREGVLDLGWFMALPGGGPGAPPRGRRGAG